MKKGTVPRGGVLVSQEVESEKIGNNSEYLPIQNDEPDLSVRVCRTVNVVRPHLRVFGSSYHSSSANSQGGARYIRGAGLRSNRLR